MCCPNCGLKQICPCSTCADQRDKFQEDAGIKPWKWVYSLGIRCGGCGFEQAAGWWENLSASVGSWHRRVLLTPIGKDMTKETLEFLDKLDQGKL